MRGRLGWISGTLADRASRGITKALVKFQAAPAEMLTTASLQEVTQLPLFKTTRPERDARTRLGEGRGFPGYTRRP